MNQDPSPADLRRMRTSLELLQAAVAEQGEQIAELRGKAVRQEADPDLCERIRETLRLTDNDEALPELAERLLDEVEAAQIQLGIKSERLVETEALRAKYDEAAGAHTEVCSFCAKPRRLVRALVAGPLVSICNECLLLSVKVVLDGQSKKPRLVERLSESVDPRARGGV